MTHRIDLTKNVSERDKTMTRILFTAHSRPTVSGFRFGTGNFDPEKTVSEFVQMLLTILLGCFICAGILKVAIMVSEIGCLGTKKKLGENKFLLS